MPVLAPRPPIATPLCRAASHRPCPLSWQVNDTLLVNELKSKESDIMTTNGVIHVVDKLLYPAGRWPLRAFADSVSF